MASSNRSPSILLTLVLLVAGANGLQVLGAERKSTEAEEKPAESIKKNDPRKPPEKRTAKQVSYTLALNSPGDQDKPLNQLGPSIQAPTGDFPRSFAEPLLVDSGVLFDSIDDIRPWTLLTSCEWEAPATRHLPLFFEEPLLERQGYTNRFYIDMFDYQTPPVIAECLQPFVSGVHFFGRIPFVPYIVGIQPPWVPVYTLGVDRPGSPVAYREQLIPLSLTGALLEAGFWTGLALGIP